MSTRITSKIVGTIRKDTKEILGYVVYQESMVNCKMMSKKLSNYTQDAMIKILMKAGPNNNVIQNAELSELNGKLRVVNTECSMDRLPIYDDKLNIVENQKAVYILDAYTRGDKVVGYRVFVGNPNNSMRVTEADLLKEPMLFANAKVVSKNNKKYISAIKKEFDKIDIGTIEKAKQKENKAPEKKDDTISKEKRYIYNKRLSKLEDKLFKKAMLAVTLGSGDCCGKSGIINSRYFTHNDFETISPKINEKYRKFTDYIDLDRDYKIFVKEILLPERGYHLKDKDIALLKKIAKYPHSEILGNVDKNADVFYLALTQLLLTNPKKYDEIKKYLVNRYKGNRTELASSMGFGSRYEISLCAANEAFIKLAKSPEYKNNKLGALKELESLPNKYNKDDTKCNEVLGEKMLNIYLASLSKRKISGEVSNSALYGLERYIELAESGLLSDDLKRLRKEVLEEKEKNCNYAAFKNRINMSDERLEEEKFKVHCYIGNPDDEKSKINFMFYNNRLSNNEDVENTANEFGFTLLPEKAEKEVTYKNVTRHLKFIGDCFPNGEYKSLVMNRNLEGCSLGDVLTTASLSYYFLRKGNWGKGEKSVRDKAFAILCIAFLFDNRIMLDYYKNNKELIDTEFGTNEQALMMIRDSKPQVNKDIETYYNSGFNFYRKGLTKIHREHARLLKNKDWINYRTLGWNKLIDDGMLSSFANKLNTILKASGLDSDRDYLDSIGFKIGTLIGALRII